MKKEDIVANLYQNKKYWTKINNAQGIIRYTMQNSGQKSRESMLAKSSYTFQTYSKYLFNSIHIYTYVTHIVSFFLLDDFYLILVITVTAHLVSR